MPANGRLDLIRRLKVNLWALMSAITFLFLIRLFNSPFVLILHVSSVSYVGLNILNIFLSVTNNFRIIDSFNTHVSLAYVITILKSASILFVAILDVCVTAHH